MENSNSNVIKRYFDFETGEEAYLFHIDEHLSLHEVKDVTLASNEELFKRYTYSKYRTYEEAEQAYQEIFNEHIHKRLSEYTTLY